MFFSSLTDICYYRMLPDPLVSSLAGQTRDKFSNITCCLFKMEERNSSPALLWKANEKQTHSKEKRWKWRRGREVDSLKYVVRFFMYLLFFRIKKDEAKKRKSIWRECHQKLRREFLHFLPFSKVKSEKKKNHEKITAKIPMTWFGVDELEMPATWLKFKDFSAIKRWVLLNTKVEVFI